MKDYKPIILNNQNSVTQIQSHKQKIFLELGSLLEGGDEEIEQRYSEGKTKGSSVK